MLINITCTYFKLTIILNGLSSSPSSLEITNNGRYNQNHSGTSALWSADAGNCNQLYKIAKVIARFKGYLVTL